VSGFVSLVGAGPGDPELLTLKALRRLQEADLVLYDALVSSEVLALAGRAQRFFVGKRAGRKSIRQETIHRLMVRAASRGKRVVRLKCGDPVVLGRGGEEALALAAAGVPFELVPGVTAAIAAPELAGIPVTHRGAASGLVLVSGHSPKAYAPVLSGLARGFGALPPRAGMAARDARGCGVGRLDGGIAEVARTARRARGEGVGRRGRFPRHGDHRGRGRLRGTNPTERGLGAGGCRRCVT
jgi:uroporphyrin-III C-methyltransferase / precorrin-2 dehydrogenase / sirohydrochlorin ferrochelatase